MALVNGYTTVADLRAHLTDEQSHLDEARLERAISTASRWIDEWCGRRFWLDPEPVTRVYTASIPGRADVDDIGTRTGLSVAADFDGDGIAETVWADGWALEPRNADANGGAYAWTAIVTSGSRRFPTGPDRLRVTTRFGWSQVPEQVQVASLLRAAALWKRKDAPFGVAGFGEYGALRITKTDPDIVDLLAPFRRYPVVMA